MRTLDIQKILIPTDFTKTSLLAVDHAAFMASLLKADLYLLHAIEDSETVLGIYEPAVVIIDVKGIAKVAQKQLNDLAEKIKREKGIEVKTLCSHGKPSNEIVAAVENHNIDIVVMGTHGANGLNEYFVGSNAYRTVTLCPCPVITVQQTSENVGFTNIVLPISDDFYSRQKVDVAISLAKQYAAKIHVLGLLDKKETDPEQFNVKLASVEKALKKANILYDLETLRSAHAAADALRYSKDIKADLVVVLTDYESELTGGFLGLFAKQIVNHSRIPVMSIKPVKIGLHSSVSLARFNSN